MSQHLTKDMPLVSPAALSTLDIRVYYEDTDAGGVMYYANYLKFFERGRTEWLRRLGVNQSALSSGQHCLFVVRKVEIQYRKPARLDDLLEIRSTISRIGSASINFDQVALRGQELLCDSAIQVCCVDTSALRPIPIPDQLRTLLEKAQK